MHKQLIKFIAAPILALAFATSVQAGSGNGISSASFTVDEGGICIFTLSDSSGTSEGDGQGDWVDTYSSSGGTNTITVHTTLTATTGSP